MLPNRDWALRPAGPGREHDEGRATPLGHERGTVCLGTRRNTISPSVGVMGRTVFRSNANRAEARGSPSRVTIPLSARPGPGIAVAACV